VIAALRGARLVGATGAALPKLAAGRGADRTLHQFSRRALKALPIRIEWVGEPDLDAPLWIANHLSWTDPIVLLSRRPMGILAKAEAAGYPVIGPWMQRAGLRFVDRDDATSRGAAVGALTRDLQARRPMLLFPEGTTTTGTLASLRPGGLLAAHRLGLRVQPFRLSTPDLHYTWTGDESLLPHLKTLLRRPARLRVEAKAPLFPSAYPEPEAWLAALRAALTEPA
jgi:1-acyl-sn-glycerol-3-phosphate acyltransferase